MRPLLLRMHSQLYLHLCSPSGFRIPGRASAWLTLGHIQYSSCRKGKGSSSFSCLPAYSCFRLEMYSSQGGGLVGFFPSSLTLHLWLLLGWNWGREKTYGAGIIFLGWCYGDLVLWLGVFWLLGWLGRCPELNLALLDQIFLLAIWNSIPSVGDPSLCWHSWERSKMTPVWHPSRGCLKPIFFLSLCGRLEWV